MAGQLPGWHLGLELLHAMLYFEARQLAASFKLTYHALLPCFCELPIAGPDGVRRELAQQSPSGSPSGSLRELLQLVLQVSSSVS